METETKEEVVCPICNKVLKNKRGLLIHSRVHKPEREEKRQAKIEQEKQEDEIIYLKLTRKQYKNINLTYSNTIKHKIECRNRARDKLGVTESYIKEDDLLSLDELIIKIEKLKEELNNKKE